MEPQGVPSNANGDDDILPISVEGIIGALTRRGVTDLTSSIDLATCSDHPLAGGGFCEVYRGELYGGTKIAIKSLKIYGSQIERDSEGHRILKRAAKELYHWSRLKHRNVLLLMGLGVFKGFISMISGWMENGDLPSYLKRNPDANRIKLCVDICEGLRYIHMNGMVHGDLKGANVMISPDGVAMIADFGNAHLKDLTVKFGNTTSRGLSYRWAAPELMLDDDVPQVSMEADVYAYGMTALETLTGKVPYEGLSERRVMWLVVSEKKVPPRPDIGISDGLWGLLNSCWAHVPSERPRIMSVGDCLETLFLRSGVPNDDSNNLIRSTDASDHHPRHHFIVNPIITQQQMPPNPPYGQQGYDAPPPALGMDDGSTSPPPSASNGQAPPPQQSPQQSNSPTPLQRQDGMPPQQQHNMPPQQQQHGVPPQQQYSMHQQYPHGPPPYSLGGSHPQQQRPALPDPPQHQPRVWKKPYPDPPQQGNANVRVGSPTGPYLDDVRGVLFYVKAMYDYTATIYEEFDFKEGDIIAVISTPEDGWWHGILLDGTRRLPGRTVFPSNYVTLF